ncbi:hypothetical protein OIV83_003984 [Microbotryomycetes sp. JL201]|nr:hypothetical protein OIV83_003984 [Microbotryomycetes sp. JL201]
MRARCTPTPTISERSPLFQTPRSILTSPSSQFPPALPSKGPYTPRDTFVPYFHATPAPTSRRVRRQLTRRGCTSAFAFALVLTIIVLCRAAHHPEPHPAIKRIPGLRRLHRRAILLWRDSLHAPPIFPLPQNQIYAADPQGNHTTTVIFLHGMLLPAVDNPLGFLSLQHPHVRWVAPQAPARPIDIVTVRLRFEFPFTAWFNMRDTKTIHMPGEWEDEAGMVESQRQINQLIRQERDLLVSRGQQPKIVLAGFSQGSAMALLASLTAYQPPEALMMFSGLVPLAPKISNLNDFAQTNVPLFWGHGKEDPVFYPEEAKVAFDWLSKDGPIKLSKTKFKVYSGVDHGWGLQELFDSSAWLNQTVPSFH